MNPTTRKIPSQVITVEGNIGSGKTTLLKVIENLIKKTQVVRQPVVEWQSIGGDSSLNLLQAFYSNPTRWAYTFQSYAYFTRIRQWTEMDKKQEFVIAERSVLSDKQIFAENGRKSNLFTDLEWAIYLEYFQWLTSQFEADKIQGIIYLNTKPEECSKRLNKRGRPEETDSVSIDYLKSLHCRHEEWLLDKENLAYPVLYIDGSIDFQSDLEGQKKVAQQIEDFLKSL